MSIINLASVLAARGSTSTAAAAAGKTVNSSIARPVTLPTTGTTSKSSTAIPKLAKITGNTIAPSAGTATKSPTTIHDLSKITGNAIHATAVPTCTDTQVKNDKYHWNCITA
jgi:hypothetical protein